MATGNSKVVRVGIYYDGNFLFHVSNYYQYHHERKQRISIQGIHKFIREKVADVEATQTKYCQIVDAHYFRGRLRASDISDENFLYKERVFDDVLIREGIVTHYLPMSREGEKGIDVLFALEAFEAAKDGKYDIVVLVACDGDFQPLVRKLHAVGCRVMTLCWDFKYIDRNNMQRETRTAQVLIDESSYPIAMDALIDDRAKKNESSINNLFVPRKEQIDRTPVPVGPKGQVYKGTIQALKNGYGFINPEQGGSALFFFSGGLMDYDFLDLRVGDGVEYEIGQNDRGPCAERIKVVSEVNNA